MESVFKISLRSFGCIQDTTEDGGLPFLSYAPTVTCYTGRHRVLTYVLEGALPLYLMVLISYAVVNGDVEYVQRQELVSPSAWGRNAVRSSTLRDQAGPKKLPKSTNSVSSKRNTQIVFVC